MDVKPTLLIIAAGMGSRYGGLKQIDSVGPNGEIIIDYSMYDAIAAGFRKIVFVIRHSFEDAFRDKIGSKLDGVVETEYVYQELDTALDGFELPGNREKPWGTGHAILCGRDAIDGPFAVINADDYYGTSSFKIMADFLAGPEISETAYAMAGYRLYNTLSDHGSVARGICQTDDRQCLEDIKECLGLEKHNGAVRFITDDGKEHFLNGDEIVSMNLWGFHPSVFDHLSEQFRDFLSVNSGNPKAEFFIPSVVDNLIKSGSSSVKVLPTDDSWFGVTYKKDRPIAQQCINTLIEKGVYPRELWT